MVYTTWYNHHQPPIFFLALSQQKRETWKTKKRVCCLVVCHHVNARLNCHVVIVWQSKENGTTRNRKGEGVCVCVSVHGCPFLGDCESLWSDWGTKGSPTRKLAQSINMSEGSYNHNLSQNDSKGLFDIGFADKLWAKYFDSHAYFWIIYGVWSASDVARIYLYMISAPLLFPGWYDVIF